MVLVARFQRQPESDLSTTIHGVRWSIEGQLLAEVFDALAIGNWQRTGNKNARKPKRLPRPWEKQNQANVLGSKPLPISKIKDWWDSRSRKP